MSKLKARQSHKYLTQPGRGDERKTCIAQTNAQFTGPVPTDEEIMASLPKLPAMLVGAFGPLLQGTKTMNPVQVHYCV